MMPQLRISNGLAEALPGLGRIQKFTRLSEKRVTKCVRKALRARYGQDGVKVSCSAELDGTSWVGQCRIGGFRFEYRIYPP
jgi:hypothetical protein